MVYEKVIAVIPALNEEETILQVIQGLKEQVNEIILVDDASTDKTAELAKAAGAIVISNKVTQGYDKAISRGFARAVERKADIILTFDADGQHNSKDIPDIIEPILKGEADVVIGRRPYCARFFEKVFAIYSKYKIGIDDPLCGLKAYKRQAYDDIGYFDNISSIGTELMFNVKLRGYRVTQKDITLKRRADTPRFGRRIKANYKIAKAFFKILFLRGVSI